MIIFVNGKQKRVKRPPTVDGMDADEFIRRNADPIWLHQNELWEYLTDTDEDSNSQPGAGRTMRAELRTGLNHDIEMGDARMTHVYFDVSGVAGVG